MHHNNPARWKHTHRFEQDYTHAEHRTRLVIAITGTMMLVEIAAGMIFNSMALLADGWHMCTHLTAFLITALAYYFSRRHAADPQFSFGTGKMGVLGGFTSAVVLAMIALFMAGESVHRCFVPLPIHFNQAIAVAIIGLLVNLVCALLLQDHHHAHQHDYVHDPHHHHDLNLRAAYIHVLADTLTSVTAIIALTTGKFLGWTWLDPLMGIVGSGVVSIWAYSLIRDTSGILLDHTPTRSDLPEEIKHAVESDGDSLVTDLHIWQVAAGRYAAIVSIVAHHPKPAEDYRQLLSEHEELAHVTIETRQCHAPEEAFTPCVN
ncbi:MAG: Cadmium, cobalt and zinc/H(+)-K(+) antiporter [Phycisphaerae bacterium]|nr:Cadmium, cobalt and zinc/H(+)-K(+) antiporter [Phycisphaerae bacterium]